MRKKLLTQTLAHTFTSDSLLILLAVDANDQIVDFMTRSFPSLFP